MLRHRHLINGNYKIECPRNIERSADSALMKARQYARASPGVTECARCAARARCHAPPPSPPPASWENGKLWGTESAPVPLTSTTCHTRSTCVAIHIYYLPTYQPCRFMVLEELKATIEWNRQF